MAKTFILDFSHFKNISIKMSGDDADDTSQYVDIDPSTPYEVIIDRNDLYDGHRCLLFYGETEDFIAAPSITIKGTNETLYTANATGTDPYDPYKYYLNFGENWDGRAYIGNIIYIPAANFQSDAKVNCGGIDEGGGFYNNDFGLIGIYEVDKNNILSMLAYNRFNLVTMGDDDEFGEIFNITDFIKTLYKTHIAVNAVEQLETIYINGFAVRGQGKPIEEYIIDFETDNIKIQGHYNNVLDNDTEIKINIPYYGLYELDGAYINHNLKLKFICDLMTNNTLCNIYIDDIAIDTVELKTGYEVPLKDVNINETRQRIYSIYPEDCYITLKERRIAESRIETIKANTTIQNEIDDNDLSGFIRCDSILLNDTSITDSEFKEIETILKSGIII